MIVVTPVFFVVTFPFLSTVATSSFVLSQVKFPISGAFANIFKFWFTFTDSFFASPCFIYEILSVISK